MVATSSESRMHELFGSSTTIEGRHTQTHLDAHQAAALSARAKKTAARVEAAKALAEARRRSEAEKQVQRLAKKQEKERRRAEAEIEAQELKQRRERAEKERRERKAREKREEREAREERRRQDGQKRQKEIDNERSKRHLEGVAWGFDDRAGVRRAVSPERSGGCSISDGNVQHGEETQAEHPDEADEIGQRTGRRRHKGNTWGIEAGGPGPEVVFEFGVPVNAARPMASGGWKRRNKE